MKEEKIILKKLLNCAYVIIALIAINTLIVLIGVVNDSGSKKTSSTSPSNTPSEQKNDNTEYDVSMMKSVDVNDIVKLYNNDKKSVIYMGRATCGYCVQFLPTLQKAQKEYGYKTNYLDITKVSQDDVKKLYKIDNKDKFLENNYGATPMVIIVGDGKIVDTWLGYSEYDSFAQFLEKNGFEK